MAKIKSGGPNRYIVSLEQRYNDTVSAPGGTKFYIYKPIKEEWNRRTWGVVVGLPSNLNSRATLATPNPDEGDVIPSSRLDMDVNEGDIIHFRYSNNVDDHLLIIDGDKFLMVWADDVLAVEREEGIIPVGGKMLVSPITEKVAASNLIHIPKAFASKTPTHKAKVEKVGRPLKGDNKLDVEKGDIVYFRFKGEKQDFGEGREYHVIYQRDVFAYESQ